MQKSAIKILYLKRRPHKRESTVTGFHDHSNLPVGSGK
jgi:hypothetical protein